MRWTALVAAALGAAALVGPGCGARPESLATVSRIGDGDTIRLVGGQRVRLVQIDAPELGAGECYARAARAELSRLLPPGTRVRLESDPRLDEVDRFGRRLAYVFRRSEHVNHTLVLRGAASVWYRSGVRGRHARELEAAAREARASGRGLWGACPGTRYDPARAVRTGRSPGE